MSPRLPTLACLACLAGLAAAAAPAAATPYDEGERLLFTGIVTDTGGKPVPGVQVVLEAARHAFSLRDLRRAQRDARRVGAATDAHGQYTIEWAWDDHFNRFQVLAGVVLRHGKEERLEVLEREDVTERVAAGSPIVSAIVVHNRALVDRWHEFMASVQSPDQHRVYEEMGTPDDVKRVSYAGRREREDAEVSWWYFAAGKVYHFSAGRLDQVERFDPVQRF
ncbi:MAG TPA: carboxypeptidase-like regulatory domain-containing protein [Thermoanaerobaculia bacterium]|nr:carboxypeptidase-like regulatory domain-containing protein [Thermoanaerobaculia bacterium]